MKSPIRKLALASLLAISTSAFAGGGLSMKAISNLAKGDVLSAAIGGGLGAASIAHGVRLVQNGSIGWGVFFIILEEKDVITTEDRANLEGADVSTKEAFLEIIGSDLSEEQKASELSALEL